MRRRPSRRAIDRVRSVFPASTGAGRRAERTRRGEACLALGPRAQKRNAPSRWRLRPASRLTAAEAIACRGAINLGRSVLGAIGTLGERASYVKALASELLRNLRSFLFAQSRTAINRMCSGHSREEKRAGHEGPAARKFAEPGTLSSTFPTNLPLPRSAPRGGFVLPAPRARRSRNVRQRTCPIKG